MSGNENTIFDTDAPVANLEAQWISLADLMAGLMMIFMLIAISYMIKVEADTAQMTADAARMKTNAAKLQETAQKMRDDAAKMKLESAKIQQIAIVYQQLRTQLYDQLTKEFEKDLPVWGAEINKDLSIRFKDPEALFNRGEDQLKPRFQKILADFFPRYIKIITSPAYKPSIQEIRIEGHTSSIWLNTPDTQEAYFKNMELSQSRTRSALRFVLGLPDVQQDAMWMRKFITANGLSSSRPILSTDGKENEVLSQRVEFRIRTDADARIDNILQSVIPTPATVPQ